MATSKIPRFPLGVTVQATTDLGSLLASLPLEAPTPCFYSSTFNSSVFSQNTVSSGIITKLSDAIIDGVSFHGYNSRFYLLYYRYNNGNFQLKKTYDFGAIS